MGLFGPSKTEVWRTLSERIGGTFVAGSELKGDRLDVHVEKWIVTLDAVKENNTIYTRLRAPFHNPSGLRFTITRTGPFAELEKGLGIQEVVVGDPCFDEAFGVTGNDCKAIRAMLKDPLICKLLQKLPNVHFEIKDNDGWFGSKFPADTDELYFIARGAIKDLNQLKGLFDLFGEVLHQLTAIGVATEADPGVKL
jgi:hypothetical protein